MAMGWLIECPDGPWHVLRLNAKRQAELAALKRAKVPEARYLFGSGKPGEIGACPTPTVLEMITRLMEKCRRDHDRTQYVFYFRGRVYKRVAHSHIIHMRGTPYLLTTGGGCAQYPLDSTGQPDRFRKVDLRTRCFLDTDEGRLWIRRYKPLTPLGLVLANAADFLKRQDAATVQLRWAPLETLHHRGPIRHGTTSDENSSGSDGPFLQIAGQSWPGNPGLAAAPAVGARLT